MKQRNYFGSDVNMLSACLIISENAKAEEAFLSSKRSAWTPPFFEEYTEQVMEGFSIIGVNRVHELVDRTLAMNAARTKLLAEIAELKVQLKVDLADDKPALDNLLNKMGIGKTAPDYKKTQQGLVDTVQMLAAALTPEVVALFVEKGISAPEIETLLADAKAFHEANVRQDIYKGESRRLTSENIEQLNAIYEKGVGIAKIARTFFKGQPAKQDKFSYKKIIGSLSSLQKAPVEAPDAENT